MTKKSKKEKKKQQPEKRGGEVKNGRRRRTEKGRKTQNKESWREEIKGENSGETERKQRKKQRDGSKDQNREGKHRRRQRAREKRGKCKLFPARTPHGCACVHTLWWVGLFVMCFPARVQGADILTALPSDREQSQGQDDDCQTAALEKS